jgi:hypothetical protein
LNVTNNYPGTTIQPEICVVCANSGLFITEQGQSSTFISILSKELVLTTSESTEVPEISRGVYDRVMGGSMMARHPAKNMKHHKSIAHKRMMGGGLQSGISGGSLQGGISGGMMHRKSKLHRLVR